MSYAGLRACGCGKPLSPPAGSRRFRCASCSVVYDRSWRQHGTSPVAKPGAWQAKPPQGKVVPLPARWDYSPEDLERLRWGFIPRVMEDRWFIVVEGEQLRFYRSWTGQFCFSARLTDGGIDGVETLTGLESQVTGDRPVLRALIQEILIGGPAG